MSDLERPKDQIPVQVIDNFVNQAADGATELLGRLTSGGSFDSMINQVLEKSQGDKPLLPEESLLLVCYNAACSLLEDPALVADGTVKLMEAFITKADAQREAR